MFELRAFWPISDQDEAGRGGLFQERCDGTNVAWKILRRIKICDGSKDESVLWKAERLSCVDTIQSGMIKRL